MHRGYVRLWRKGVENALFKKPLVWHFWCYCLLRANYKDCEIEFKGRPFLLKRGSFLMSFRSAAERTGLTARNIRTAVTTLVNFGMIEKSTRETTQQATVIRVCNYGLYQAEKSNGDTVNDTAATQRRHSGDTAATLDNKDKELIKKANKDREPDRTREEPFESDCESPNENQDVQEAFLSCNHSLGMSEEETEEAYVNCVNHDHFPEAVRFALQENEKAVLEKPVGFLIWACKEGKTSKATRGTFRDTTRSPNAAPYDPEFAVEEEENDHRHE